MFSSLVLIALLGAPLIHLFQALPALGSAQGCFKRIQSFLELYERSEPGKIPSAPDATEGKEQNADDVVIELQHASFGWSREVPVLQDVGLQVTKGSFTCIMGNVGTGKSLLLKSIIGESEKLSGSVSVPRNDIAYCSQTPWVENLSAEETWTQYNTRGEEWLKQVHEACRLDDITRLPDYRDGKIGSGGVRLSGGQRQRLVSDLTAKYLF
jgi:ABC-type bacteriocin/lantibiotic exporter with double-glycine peptidase domain